MAPAVAVIARANRRSNPSTELPCSGLLRLARNDGIAIDVLGSRRRAGLHQLVDNRIHQRLKRGVDDIRRYADRGPALAHLVFALDQVTGYGFGAAVKDPHTVVVPFHSFD